MRHAALISALPALAAARGGDFGHGPAGVGGQRGASGGFGEHSPPSPGGFGDHSPPSPCDIRQGCTPMCAHRMVPLVSECAAFFELAAQPQAPEPSYLTDAWEFAKTCPVPSTADLLTSNEPLAGRAALLGAVQDCGFVAVDGEPFTHGSALAGARPGGSDPMDTCRPGCFRLHALAKQCTEHLPQIMGGDAAAEVPWHPWVAQLHEECQGQESRTARVWSALTGSRGPDHSPAPHRKHRCPSNQFRGVLLLCDLIDLHTRRNQERPGGSGGPGGPGGVGGDGGGWRGTGGRAGGVRGGGGGGGGGHVAPHGGRFGEDALPPRPPPSWHGHWERTGQFCGDGTCDANELESLGRLCPQDCRHELANTSATDIRSMFAEQVCGHAQCVRQLRYALSVCEAAPTPLSSGLEQCEAAPAADGSEGADDGTTPDSSRWALHMSVQLVLSPNSPIAGTRPQTKTPLPPSEASASDRLAPGRGELEPGPARSGRSARRLRPGGAGGPSCTGSIAGPPPAAADRWGESEQQPWV